MRFISDDGSIRVDVVQITRDDGVPREYFRVAEHGFFAGEYGTVTELQRAVDISTLQEFEGE